MTKIIAVTACPSGVAHTYMAAEALESAAKAKGWDVKVETQGSIGLENELTAEDVASADMVILTKDIGIKFEERFAGKNYRSRQYQRRGKTRRRHYEQD
ncbi:PTS system fructose-like IIB component 1 precursor [Salmonella enterica subsp. enterica]|nr:PTS system fructose-like IIB component 1 precursor [Salmonella enterica subsp. enterica]VUC91326.1 PTS system fructose-like IIB component 1 precursor [Salmonella sp. NCTC 11881]